MGMYGHAGETSHGPERNYSLYHSSIVPGESDEIWTILVAGWHDVGPKDPCYLRQSRAFRRVPISLHLSVFQLSSAKTLWRKKKKNLGQGEKARVFDWFGRLNHGIRRAHTAPLARRVLG